jgi:hypothetical protein
MGVERSVTRWFVLRQSILQDIAQLEAQLADMLSDDSQRLSPELETRPTTELETLATALEIAHFQLKALGPCPKPMMG